MVSPAEVGAMQKPDVKVTLYWLEKSRAQRILWMLEELELPYDIKTFKRGSDMLAGPELKKVHPLGKSPMIGIKTPTMESERIIPESALIVEYLSDHFGKHLIPQRYKDGQDGQIGGETDEWMRYRHFMHYAEGSLMTLLILALVVLQIKNAPIIVRPLTKVIAGRIESAFLTKNLNLHFSYVEEQLKTSGGDFICGKNLTGADIMMVYPLEAAQGARGVLDTAKYPNIGKYVERLLARPAYQRAIQKIKDETGEYSATL